MAILHFVEGPRMTPNILQAEYFHLIYFIILNN